MDEHSIDNGLENVETSLQEPESLMPGPEEPISSEIRPSSKPLPKPTPTILSTLRHGSEILSKLWASILGRGTKPAYPTGLKDLDEVVWGVHKQEVMVIGARTSHGKSSLAYQIAINLAALGQKVVYFSLEMSSEQMIERLISNLCGINSKLLRQGLALNQVKSNEKKIRDYIESLNLLLDDTHGYHLSQVKTICEELKPDFVFIDYIQMVSPKGYSSKLEAIDDYLRSIKDMAQNLNFGAIVVSQINREGTEGMGMHHLKGSGTLEEHPDTVLLCEWLWQKGEYWVRIDKQRHGELGKVQLNFIPEYYRFENWRYVAKPIAPNAIEEEHEQSIKRVERAGIGSTARILPKVRESGDRSSPPPRQYKDE